MDQIDLEIIEELKKNAKAKIHQISKKIGIPPSTVHHRIKKMEKERVIKRWNVEIDYQQVGLPIKALVLVNFDVTELKRMGKSQERIALLLKKTPNIEKIDIITGEADMLLTIRAKSMEHLQEILFKKVQSIEGITRTKTIISLSEWG